MIDGMRFSEEPEIVSFLKVYDETPRCDRNRIPLEAFAMKAQVSFKGLCGAFMLCFRSIQIQTSAMVALREHPDVVESTAQFARLASGDRDRRMLHEAVGFLPTSKGASINFNFPGAEKEMPENEAPATDDVLVAPDVNDLFPMINEKQEGWQQLRTKMLQEKN